MEDQKRHAAYLEAKAIYCLDPKIRSEELAWHCNHHVWQEIGIPWTGGQNPTKRRLEADRDRQLARKASSGIANQFKAVMRQERPPNTQIHPMASTKTSATSAQSSTLVRHDTLTSMSVRAPMQAHPQPLPSQRKQQPLPPTAPASWRPANDAPCANCGRTDHKLIICMGPLINGCIRGCPLHNSKSHNLDECPLPLAHHAAQKAYYLFKARNGRPPLEVKGNLIMMHNGDYFGWPWTPAFAEKNKEFYKTYDYKSHPWGSNNLGGSGSGTSEPVLADPAWIDGSWKTYLSVSVASNPIHKLPAKRAREEEVNIPNKKVRNDEKEPSSPPHIIMDPLTIKAAFELQQLIELSQSHRQTGGGGASMIDLTSRSTLSAITKYYHNSVPKDLEMLPIDKSEIRKRQELVNTGVETALFITYPSLVEKLRSASQRKDEEIEKQRSRLMELENELHLRELKLKVFTRREQMKAAVVKIERMEDLGVEDDGGEDEEDEEEEGEIRFIGTDSESGKIA